MTAPCNPTDSNRTPSRPMDTAIQLIGSAITPSPPAETATVCLKMNRAIRELTPKKNRDRWSKC